MKILVLSTSFPLNESDASGRFIFEQVKRLNGKGRAFEVLVPHHDGAKYFESLGGARIFRFRYALGKLERVCYGAGISENINKSLVAKLELPIFFLTFLVLAIYRARRVDIVHAHWITISGLVGAICKILLRTPLLVTVHGSDLRISKKKYLPRIVNKFVLRKADQIIVVNSELKKMVRSLNINEKKVSVVYNGVSELDELLKLPIRKPFRGNVLFVSRLVPIKNLEFLLRAFSFLKESKPSLKLTVVGDGPQRKELVLLSKHLGISKKVNFVGKKAFKDIVKYLATADIFVLPQKAEGFGVSLLEAMAAGIPTISGKVLGIDEIIKEGETGFVVNPNKPEELAQLIKNIIGNNLLLNKVAAQAREKVRSLSWENQSEKILEIYKSLQKEKLLHG